MVYFNHGRQIERVTSMSFGRDYGLIVPTLKRGQLNSTTPVFEMA
jgi:hypothetical protein